MSSIEKIPYFFIKMNDWEQIILDNISEKEFDEAESRSKMDWKKYVFIKKLSRRIYFNYIQNAYERWLFPKQEEQKKIWTNKKNISLLGMSSTEQKKMEKENPEKYYKMYNEENENRKQIQRKISIALEKTYDGRKKRFLERRVDILKKLADEEEKFELDTTISKIKEYDKLKVKQKINEIQEKK